MITLQQLKYFVELAHSEHMTRTAEKFCITQTSLSNTISALERQLGIKLFDRVGRSVRLNDVGADYLRYAEEALSSLDKAREVIETYRSQNQDTLSVVLTSSYVWGDILTEFHARYRSYHIRQISCGPDRFHSLLINQEVDFCIADTEDIDMTDLAYRIIRTEDIYLCLSPRHPLASREGLYLKELAGESFISLPKGSGFRKYCDRLFQQAGVSYNTIIECDNQVRRKLIASDFGVALTTGIVRRTDKDDSAVYVPILDSFAKRPISIIWNPRRHLKQAAQDFREYILTEATVQ